jgi:hypothetical protein
MEWEPDTYRFAQLLNQCYLLAPVVLADEPASEQEANFARRLRHLCTVPCTVHASLVKPKGGGKLLFAVPLPTIPTGTTTVGNEPFKPKEESPSIALQA